MFMFAMIFNLLAALVFMGAFFLIIKSVRLGAEASQRKVREAFAVVVLAMALASVAGFCRSYGLDTDSKVAKDCAGQR